MLVRDPWTNILTLVVEKHFMDTYTYEKNTQLSFRGWEQSAVPFNTEGSRSKQVDKDQIV